ncbi:PH domain-containing protein [Lentilactobacillus otakiensis]|uniref:PH domain-containing protein n=1 Tax=Lentilactobacillus otakiensis TaxID=481720 RepID=UPI003D17047A
MNESNHLPAQIKTVWRISALFNTLLAAAVGVAGLVIYHFWDYQWWVYAASFFFVIAIIDFIVETSLVPYRYSFWLYTVTDDAVELRSGFIFRKLVSIPIARVQDVTLSAGPILQSQKLQEVRITTASTSHRIDGVEPSVGEQLRKQIMKLAVEVGNHDV